VALGGHFFPGFLEDVDNLFIVVAGGEVGEVVFQEDEADDVFEGLGVGVGFDFFFADQGGDAGDGGSVVADFLEDLGRLVGVEFVEGGSPGEVTDAIHGIGGAGDLPAADVLGAGGEAQGFGRVRAEAVEPDGHSLRIFEGAAGGVFGVGGIDF